MGKSARTPSGTQRKAQNKVVQVMKTAQATYEEKRGTFIDELKENFEIGLCTDGRLI